MKKTKARKIIRLPAPTTGPSPSTSTSTPTTPIRFSVNIIVPATADRLARFLQAGDPSPYRDVNEVPPILLPFVLQPSDEHDPEHDDSPQSLNITLGTVYSVDERGHRRSIQREVVRLEQAQEEQRYWEEALSAEPSEQVKAALEIVQQDFEVGVARDRAEAESRARAAEMAEEHAKAFVEEGDQIDDDAVHVSPTIQNL